MNAAFLLMTSAMLVGQAGEKVPVPAKVAPAPAPIVASSACGSNCGNSDPCGCEGFGHRLRGRLRGLFNRDTCDTCQPATCQTSHSHFSLFRRSGCDDCGPARVWNWQPKHTHHQTCAPTCNDPCANNGLNILGRLRGIFHRRDTGCCEGGCSSPVTTTTAPAKAGEPIQNPGKKMPDAPKTTPNTTPVVPKTTKPQEVRIETPAPVSPVAPSIIPAVPNTPTVEITPVPAPSPRVEGSDPF